MVANLILSLIPALSFVLIVSVRSPWVHLLATHRQKVGRRSTNLVRELRWCSCLGLLKSVHDQGTGHRVEVEAVTGALVGLAFEQGVVAMDV